MNPSGTLLFLSSRSWLLDGTRQLRRPNHCDEVLGMDRNGVERAHPCTHGLGW